MPISGWCPASAPYQHSGAGWHPPLTVTCYPSPVNPSLHEDHDDEEEEEDDDDLKAVLVLKGPTYLWQPAVTY